MGSASPKPKRINTSSKGAVVERKAIAILEHAGYKVHRCVRTGAKRGPFYVSISNDIFGCVDLVAKAAGDPTLWIQVTADSGVGRKAKDLLEVPWTPEHDNVEIWRWVGGRKDRTHKTTGKPLDGQYFQVYTMVRNPMLDRHPGPDAEGPTFTFEMRDRLREPAGKEVA